MKKFYVITNTILVIVFFFFMTIGCATLGLGEDPNKASKRECVAKVKDAAKLIKNIGLKPALEKIMDKNGPYIWKDSYVFVMDDDKGKILAHPVARFIGFKMKKYRDADGTKPFSTLLETAKTENEGWIKYMYPKPGEKTASLKTVYFLKVPDEKAIVCAGFYK